MIAPNDLLDVVRRYKNEMSQVSCEDIQSLSVNADRGLALQAGWQMFVQGKARAEVRGDNLSALWGTWLSGFLLGSLYSSPPGWWLRDICGGSLDLEGWTPCDWGNQEHFPMQRTESGVLARKGVAAKIIGDELIVSENGRIAIAKSDVFEMGMQRFYPADMISTLFAGDSCFIALCCHHLINPIVKVACISQTSREPVWSEGMFRYVSNVSGSSRLFCDLRMGSDGNVYVFVEDVGEGYQVDAFASDDGRCELRFGTEMLQSNLD